MYSKWIKWNDPLKMLHYINYQVLLIHVRHITLSVFFRWCWQALMVALYSHALRLQNLCISTRSCGSIYCVTIEPICVSLVSTVHCEVTVKWDKSSTSIRLSCLSTVVFSLIHTGEWGQTLAFWWQESERGIPNTHLHFYFLFFLISPLLIFCHLPGFKEVIL